MAQGEPVEIRRQGKRHGQGRGSTGSGTKLLLGIEQHLQLDGIDRGGGIGSRLGGCLGDIPGNRLGDCPGEYFGGGFARCRSRDGGCRGIAAGIGCVVWGGGAGAGFAAPVEPQIHGSHLLFTKIAGQTEQAQA